MRPNARHELPRLSSAVPVVRRAAVKLHQVSALCDGAYALLGAAEAAERNPADFDELELRRLMLPLLLAALPLYTAEAIKDLQAEAALAAHGGNAAAAAQALGVARGTLYNRRRRAAAVHENEPGPV